MRRQSRGRRPFHWATGLWGRMQRRREALKDGLARSIASQGMPAEPDSGGLRASDHPAGIGGTCSPRAPLPEAEEQAEAGEFQTVEQRHQSEAQAEAEEEFDQAD